ncbi:MAG: nicotinate-nucleotide adenylyltransferase [Chloroflexi bacterium]|nr:nicotinate-nucleotide adenylyltransferase [Chloroflexota bacterium]
MRIGVLGGTFDPIHMAHLIVAEEVRSRLELEEVVFVPTGEPWMKAGTPLSSSHHRLNMVRLAVSSNPFFRVSSVEIDRPGPSYTLDTLEALLAEYGEGVEIFFILGVDALTEFHRWKEPERILELAKLAVVGRPGFKGGDPSPKGNLVEGASDRIVKLDGTNIEISAGEIRRRVAEGRSIRYRVCDEVADYIMHHGLYRDGSK